MKKQWANIMDAQIGKNIVGLLMISWEIFAVVKEIIVITSIKSWIC